MAESDTDIQSCDDIRTQIGKGVDELAKRRYIIKRAIDLGCADLIPDDWEIEFNGGE